MKVLLRTADGSETVWTEGSEYDLSGAGAPGGGTVSVNSSPTDYTPASGETLVVKLAVPPSQETSLPLGGAFPSTAVEGMADLAALRDQGIAEELSRAVKFKETTALADVEFPEPEAGRVARWNAAGDALENSTLPTFLDGSGAPAGGLGEVDDRYIDSDTGDTYKKTGASSWTLTGSFEGPVGPQGVQGVQGIQGIQGPQGDAGADGVQVLFGTGAPAGGLGGIGDYYKATDSGDFYEKTGTSAWTLRGNDTGSQGVQGIRGDQGIQGIQGLQGVAGSKVLFGVGAPSGGLGGTGDYFKDTSNGDFYEKTGGSTWILRGNDTGPQGATGATGATGSVGTDGVDGMTLLNGTGAPSGGLGNDGDFYIDTTADAIYGPKAGGAWGSATTLIGPQGPQGDAGADGADGIGIAPQGSYDAGTTYSIDHGVTYQGTFWRSVQNGNQGNAPGSSPAFWEEMVVKGDTGPAGADGSGVPAGGTTGQALVKASETAGDVKWEDHLPTEVVTQAEYDAGPKTAGRLYFISG